jgi:hypothetical protein
MFELLIGMRMQFKLKNNKDISISYRMKSKAIGHILKESYQSIIKARFCLIWL